MPVSYNASKKCRDLCDWLQEQKDKEEDKKDNESC